MVEFSSTRSPRSLPLPTGAEIDILAVLWKLGSATVREIHEELGKETAYTATLKQMQTMAKKGLVVRSRHSRAHIYEPAVPGEQTREQIAGHLMKRAFGGSVISLVVSALSAKPASRGELTAIRKIVDKFAKG
jgi:BlaI family transcriptional regulator, penicillinase repressor